MELKSKQICRFCMTTNRPLVNIYKSSNQDVPLSLQIIACVSIEVFPSDKMPATICEACSSLMDFIYRFKAMCREADSSLKMVPMRKVWPEPLDYPQFEHDSPFQLIQRSEIITDEGQLVQIVDGSNILSNIKYEMQAAPIVIDEREEEEDAMGEEEEQAQEEHQEEEIHETENELIEELNLVEVEEYEEDTYSYPVARTAPKTSPSASRRMDVHVVKQEHTTSIIPPVKLLNDTIKKGKKRPDISIQSEPALKRNKHGNVDIMMEVEPEVLETDVFSCNHCSRSFPLKQLLEIHEKNHTRERESACELCPKKFFSKYDLLKHMNTHTKERPFKCVICDKAFSRSTLLYRHQKIHADVPRFDCSDCDRFFFEEDELERHTLKHKKSRPFNCLYCPKSFAFKQGLERHEVVHAELQPFPCQYCDISFNTRNKLLRHLVGHAGERPFPCKYCPKSYLMSHHLTRHMRSHAMTECISVIFSCYRCNEGFNAADVLVEHMIEEHDTVGDLCCLLCNEQFETVEENRLHLMQHAEGNQYACEFCDLIFLDEERLMNHSQDEHADEQRVYEEDLKKTVDALKDRQAQEEEEEGSGSGLVIKKEPREGRKIKHQQTRDPEIDLYWEEETEDVGEDEFVVVDDGDKGSSSQRAVRTVKQEPGQKKMRQGRINDLLKSIPKGVQVRRQQ